MEDKIIAKLLELEEKMELLVTKDEFSQFRNESITGQDKMIKILDRLDQERIFTNKWIQELEHKLEQSSKDIQQVKLHLNIA